MFTAPSVIALQTLGGIQTVGSSAGDHLHSPTISSPSHSSDSSFIDSSVSSSLLRPYQKVIIHIHIVLPKKVVVWVTGSLEYFLETFKIRVTRIAAQLRCCRIWESLRRTKFSFSDWNEFIFELQVISLESSFFITAPLLSKVGEGRGNYGRRPDSSIGCFQCGTTTYCRWAHSVRATSQWCESLSANWREIS